MVVSAGNTKMNKITHTPASRTISSSLLESILSGCTGFHSVGTCLAQECAFLLRGGFSFCSGFTLLLSSLLCLPSLWWRWCSQWQHSKWRASPHNSLLPHFFWPKRCHHLALVITWHCFISWEVAIPFPDYNFLFLHPSSLPSNLLQILLLPIPLTGQPTWLVGPYIQYLRFRQPSLPCPKLHCPAKRA